MRWEIKTVNEVVEKSKPKKSNGYEITTTKTTKERKKVQYITVGDIVEMGKSAAGAVMKLAKRLPGIMNDFRNLQNGTPTAGMLAALNGLVQPLAVVIQGAEAYKTAMKVISILTPIVKTVARGTGVWCSPGNVGDIAEIAVGTVQQILVGIAMSAIMKLKDWIWSMEFEWRSIPLKSYSKITKKLRKINEENKNRSILPKPGEEDGIYGTSFLSFNPRTYNSAAVAEEASENYEIRRKNFKSKGLSKFGNMTMISTDMEVLAKQISGDTSISTSKKCRSREGNYITEYVPSSNTLYRILSGSKEDEGIWYSDDKGKTWRRSKQKDLSFGSFAKIKNDNASDGYTYIAGTIPYISKLKKTEDSSYSKNEIGHYNKDYYNMNNSGKILKNEKTFKDSIEKVENGFSMIREQDKIMDKEEFIPACGIMYSNDNGVTWKKSNVVTGEFSLFFEYNEKESSGDPIPNRVVAADANYNGLYYTEDGKTWKRPIDLTNNEEITFDRWSLLDDSVGEAPRIKNTAFDVYTKISSKVRGIVSVNMPSFNITTKVENDILFGKELEDRQANASVKSILLHIHKSHPEIVADAKVVPNEIWETIISEIKEGKYTFKDGENGKHLEQYIDGGKVNE